MRGPGESCHKRGQIFPQPRHVSHCQDFTKCITISKVHSTWPCSQRLRPQALIAAPRQMVTTCPVWAAFCPLQSPIIPCLTGKFLHGIPFLSSFVKQIDNRWKKENAHLMQIFCAVAIGLLDYWTTVGKGIHTFGCMIQCPIKDINKRKCSKNKME